MHRGGEPDSLANHGGIDLPRTPLPPLGPEFNEALYQWEQGLAFRELRLPFQRSRSRSRGEDPGRQLADLQDLKTKLAARPRCLIHRDFQSQNISHPETGSQCSSTTEACVLAWRNTIFAALLYDPCVVLYRDQREELIALAEARSRNPQFRERLPGPAPVSVSCRRWELTDSSG